MVFELFQKHQTGADSRPSGHELAKFGLCGDWFLKKRVNHKITLHEVGKTFFVNLCVLTVSFNKEPWEKYENS